MPYRVIFTPVARSELLEAIDWYARRAPSVVSRLRAELRTVVARMAQNPFQFPEGPSDTRRVLLRHFPYVVVYTVTTEAIRVVAFFHTSRDPKRLSTRQ